MHKLMKVSLGPCLSPTMYSSCSQHTAMSRGAIGCLSVEESPQAFRIACHFGDTETEMDSTLRSTSVIVFNRLVIFVLKEADQIFRQLLGVTDDAALASGAVKKQPRCAHS